ncbi:MAG: hypothetical protein WBF06_06255 [Candidatus Acidiferrales bacterium]
MTRRTQIIVLCVLLGVFALALYIEFRPESGNVSFAPPPTSVQQYVPLQVENPALRLDEIARVHRLEYTGVHRNIFSATIPPPPPPKLTPAQIKAQQEAEANRPPPPPPPLDVPATFFGYVTDARTGHKQAFFTNGDDVFIAGEGELLLGRFRVLKIGNDTAEVEEVSSGRRATLTMQQDAAPAG